MLWPFKRKIDLPREALEPKKKILHISDTPESIYNFIFELVQTIEPSIIIHTGDLVDNLKLERKPWLRDSYEKAVRKLLKLASYSTLYIVPGNEDDEDIIKRIFGNFAIIVRPGSVMSICGRKIALGHKPEDVKGVKADLYMYGHDPKSKFGLNGIHFAYIIICPDWKIYKVPYPPGTNFDRGYKMLRGL
ncbi:metallophosphoesterase [Pyrococcus sp. ST04]|uniref:metallophosphoesterase n=1 Tax=Pyrococcus sp. ST04 TaxID=1183377 RepID=UPI000260602B|nr:metallophosphoesterase [Pyrococcus sp. ST04]AFK22783.1 putative metallophosphoesterase [Pyrococcus sp. ST04]